MFPGFYFLGRFISSYALAALVGIFTAGPLAIMNYKKKTGNGYYMLIVLLFSAIGVAVGGCLMYGITNIGYWHMLFEVKSFSEFFNVFTAIFGGSVFYGGLLGGMVAAGIVIRVKKLDGAIVTDCAAPAVPLFHCFGRIGCFLGGCCYGIESDFGFVFTDSLAPGANGVRRFPVQLTEASFLLLLFLFLLVLQRKGRCDGKLFAIYLMCYAPARFTLEFLRGDGYRGFLFGLSTSQIISIFVFAAALVWMIIRSKKLGRKVKEL